MDFKNKRIIILMPGQNMYMTRPPFSRIAFRARVERGKWKPMSPRRPCRKKPARPRRSSASRCTKYVSQARGFDSRDVGDRRIGEFRGLGRGAGGRGSALEAWEKVLVGRGFFSPPYFRQILIRKTFFAGGYFGGQAARAAGLGVCPSRRRPGIQHGQYVRSGWNRRRAAAQLTFNLFATRRDVA